jgi:hypothetical protein
MSSIYKNVCHSDPIPGITILKKQYETGNLFEGRNPKISIIR